MEIISKAFLLKENGVEVFKIKVDEENYPLVKLKLKQIHDEIISLFKQMHQRGEIKSIWIPKNKKNQKYLNELVTAKRQIKFILQNLKLTFE